MIAPFWQQVLLNAIGPLITVLGGGLVVGLTVGTITRHSQDRRDARSLRTTLVSEMTEAAVMLHIEIDRYYRAKRLDDLTEQDLMTRRHVLDDRYQKTRATGRVLENKLLAYFASGEPRKLWRQTMWVRLSWRECKAADVGIARCRATRC